MTYGFVNYWFVLVAVLSAIAAYGYSRRIIASLAVMFAILALSVPYIVIQSNKHTTVILVDDSRSMAASDTDVESLAATVEDKPNVKRIYLSSLFDDGNKSTNLEEALFYTASHIKRNGKIFLVSDMLETDGDVSSAARELLRNNIDVEVIVPDYTLENEIILSDIIIPEYITIGQEVEIAVIIEASADEFYTEILLTDLDSEHTDTFSAVLSAGYNQIMIPVNTQSRLIRYRLAIDSDRDTHKDNNACEFEIKTFDKPVVMILSENDDTENIVRLCEQYGNVHSFNRDALAGCDMLIIADDRYEVLDGELLADIDNNVRNGMGLLVLPGEYMLKNAVFSDNRFAQMLPTQMQRPTVKSSPDSCIVFIVDTSGSMAGSRLLIAKEIVRHSVRQLSEYDKVGIVEFYGHRKWAAPIQYVSDDIDINRAINRLTAGGGTVMLPALQEAHYGLLNTSASAKHIVVITDGGVEAAEYESLLRQISRDNITISFILTVSNTHSGFLSEMSMQGNGVFINVSDRFTLPRINVKTLTSKDPGIFRKTDKPITANTDLAITFGLDFEIIKTDINYIQADVKPSAQILISAGEDPLLTIWQYGLGKVALSNSDIFEKNYFDKLFVNLSRYLYKIPVDDTLSSNSPIPAFEIKSYKPDIELAQKINAMQPAGVKPDKAVIDIDKYCLLIALILFIMQVYTRRLPKHTAALIFFAGICSFGYAAGYPEVMNKGFELYSRQADTAMDTFVDAFEKSDEISDQRYALAWAIVSAKSQDKTEELKYYLVNDGSASAISSLMLIYATQSDITNALMLSERIESDENFDEEFKSNLRNEIVNIALASRDYDNAIKFYQDKNDYIAVMKLYLMQGRRDMAAQIAKKLGNRIPSDKLLKLSNALVDMGFGDMAIDRINIILERKDNFYYEALVFVLDYYIRKFEYHSCRNLINNAISEFDFTVKQLYELAIYLERCRYYEDAMAMYEDIYEQTQAIDCLMRIASLAEYNGDLQQSYNLWRQIWNSSTDTFRLYQITPRLLDIASKSDNLAELVIELEDVLNSGKASHKELDLLIDIYTSMDEPIAAVEIVKQFYPGDSIESMQKRYHIYRRCRLYGKCSRLLMDMISLDTDNSEEYLQDLAIVAMERRNHKQALEASRILAQMSDNLDLSFTAGLYSMFGDYERARDIYASMLAASPENYELWLLWSRQIKDNPDEPVEDAAYYMLDKLSEDCDDELFIIIADSIMNIEPSPRVYQLLYQKITDRIAKNPDKIYMYQLAVDVIVEGKLRDNPADYLLMASSYDRQRRFAFLREAMDISGGLSQRKIDIASVLVYMGWKCPPEQNIALGKLFLENGRHKLAEYMFRQNSLLTADSRNLYLLMADIYQRQSNFRLSLNVIKEALSLMPEDIGLLTEAARYYEILGEFEQAYDKYRLVYEKYAGRELVEGASSVNIDFAAKYKEIAFEGMVVCADEQLPEDIRKLNEQLHNAQPAKKAARNTSANNPTNPAKASKQSQELNIDAVDIELQDIITADIFDGKVYIRLRNIVSLLNQEQAEYLLDEFTDFSEIVGQNFTFKYVYALLADIAGKEDVARDFIKECFEQQPDNRYIKFSLKSIYEESQLYKELADILLSGMETSAGVHDWRELTRLYSKAGMSEKAMWANSYAASDGHLILQTLDYIYLYDKENDIDKLKQYFRKYQTDCRFMGRYYAILYNSWDLEQQQQRQTVYKYLSRYNELKDDFFRYKRVVYPTRNDYNQYMDAIDSYKHE